MRLVPYRPDIDGLRALAVLPVLLFHIDPAWAPGGFLGVDVFFVISGYLISSILYRQQHDGSFSIVQFYQRRVRRLFPALATVILATVVFGYFALNAAEYRRLGNHAASAILFLVNFKLMGESGYFDLASYTKPLMHLWSLAVEEQFYLAWPVMLLLLARLRIARGLALALLALASLGFAVWLSEIRPDVSYYHPIARFWELLAGALVAWLHVSTGRPELPGAGGSPALRDVCACAGLLLVASAMLFFDAKGAHPGWVTLWPVAGAALLIAAGPQALANRWLAARGLVLVGLISYPLYLWHWPMLAYVRIMGSGEPPQAYLLAAAALSVLAAWATYRWIETPVRLGAGVWRSTRGWLVGMGSLAVLSTAIAVGEGWPGRPVLRHMQALEAQLVRSERRDDACLQLFAPGTAPVYCRLQPAGERMLALLGDSHAHVLFDGVAELAAGRGHGTLLLANSGCPPLAGAVTGRTESERRQCARDIEKLLDAVLRDKRVVSVVLATRGPQYLDGTGFGPVEAHYNYPPIAAETASGDPNHADPARVFGQGLLRTAARLHRRGIAVTYVLQVPELGVPAVDCLGRPLALATRREPCSVDYGAYARRMQDYRGLVRGLAATAPYLHIVDLEHLLCDGVRCSGMRGGQLLYADDNHLSVNGSRLVAPEIVRQALADAGTR